MNLASVLWLLPVLPLGASALLATGLLRAGRFAAISSSAAVLGSAILAVVALVATIGGQRTSVSVPWLSSGGRDLNLALMLDPLSAVMAAVVAVVGLIICLYAVGYMAGDPAFGRFFATLSGFIGAMLTLVLAGDLITLFIAWELVGVASYLLIGFWHARPAAPPAASKAFLVTRLADLALLFAVLWLINLVGTGSIVTVTAAATMGRIATPTLLIIAVLVIIGAAGKSAQFPFQGWLPDAMAGPTPVSALLHSATLVAAGVFLIARLFPLFLAVPSSLTLLAWLGAVTALLGATVALVQTDLKRLLAYSTMSQYGLMFVGLGAGRPIAAIVLLVVHAFFKSTLFLAAGAVDRAVDGTAFARMGGLARRLPATLAAFSVAGAALAGLPITLAPPAKDGVLAAALPLTALFVVALLASFGTALYSARAFGLVFLGRPAPDAPVPQRVTALMRGALLSMTIGVFVAMSLDSPLLGAPLARWLGGASPEIGAVTATALVIAVVGIGLSLLARLAWPERVLWPWLGPLVPLLQQEYGLRPLYHGLARLVLALCRGVDWADRRVFAALTMGVVWGGQRLALVLGTLDRRVFDALGAVAARGTLTLARQVGLADQRGLDAGITASGTGILAASQRLRRIQTGMVGNYLLALALWGLGIAVVAVIVVLVH